MNSTWPPPWSQIFNEEREILKRESSRRTRAEGREPSCAISFGSFLLVFLSSTNDSSRPRSNLPCIHKHPEVGNHSLASFIIEFFNLCYFPSSSYFYRFVRNPNSLSCHDRLIWILHGNCLEFYPN